MFSKVSKPGIKGCLLSRGVIASPRRPSLFAYRVALGEFMRDSHANTLLAAVAASASATSLPFLFFLLLDQYPTLLSVLAFPLSNFVPLRLWTRPLFLRTDNQHTLTAICSSRHPFPPRAIYVRRSAMTMKIVGITTRSHYGCKRKDGATLLPPSEVTPNKETIMFIIQPSLWVSWLSYTEFIEHGIRGKEFFTITLSQLVDILPRPVTTYAERRRLLSEIRALGTPVADASSPALKTPANVRWIHTYPRTFEVIKLLLLDFN